MVDACLYVVSFCHFVDLLATNERIDSMHMSSEALPAGNSSTSAMHSCDPLGLVGTDNIKNR